MKELEPLGPHFGSIVHGVDPATATDGQITGIRAALTGRKGIFVNPGFTSHIVGVPEAESRGILTKPEHIVRHRRHPGDVAMWDNRSASHRVMHRITLRGDLPVGSR